MTVPRLPLLALAASLVLLDPAGAPAQPLPAQPPLPAGGFRRTSLRPPQPAAPTDQATADRKALEAADLKPTDADALLSYIRQRTLSDTDLSRIRAVIRRLGADDFEERLK